jgi:hypothetical protein
MTVKVIGAVWSQGPPPFLFLASGMEAHQGGDAFGSVHDSRPDPIGEGTPFA